MCDVLDFEEPEREEKIWEVLLNLCREGMHRMEWDGMVAAMYEAQESLFKCRSTSRVFFLVLRCSLPAVVA